MATIVYPSSSNGCEDVGLAYSTSRKHRNRAAAAMIGGAQFDMLAGINGRVLVPAPGIWTAPAAA